MLELIEANWPWFLIVLLIGVAVAWLIFVGSRRTKVTREEDGADDMPAARNQALIDAPPATASVPPAAPMGVGGAGTVAAAAAQEASVKAASEAEADPSPEAAPPPAAEPTPSSEGDDLTRIKGVGPKLAALLGELGVTRFEQIAGWDDAEIDRIDAQLGRFEGRIRRDDWVTQARLLADGDTAGYEARFGKL